jgi:hypothetical protein
MIPTPEPNLPMWFEAITDISNWLMAIAALVALIGLFNWRVQAKWDKKLEVVKRLVLLIYKIQNELKLLRSNIREKFPEFKDLDKQKILDFYGKLMQNSKSLDSINIDIDQATFEAEIFTDEKIREAIDQYVLSTVYEYKYYVTMFFMFSFWDFSNLTKENKNEYEKCISMLFESSMGNDDFNAKIGNETKKVIAELKNRIR